MFLYVIFSYKCWRVPDHKSGPSISLPKGRVEQHVYANVAATDKSTLLKNIQNYYTWHLQMCPVLNAFEILTDALSHVCELHVPGPSLKLFLETSVCESRHKALLPLFGSRIAAPPSYLTWKAHNIRESGTGSIKRQWHIIACSL